MSNFDSYFAFERATRDLFLFNILTDQRRILGSRQNNLHEWVVLGRFLFTCSGRVFKFCPPAIPAEIYPHFPTVLSGTDYIEFLQRYHTRGDLLPSATLEAHIPQSDQFCHICNSGWTIKNCHDCYLYSGRPVHGKCMDKIIAENERERFLNLFEEAGYLQVYLAPIPCPYPHGCFCPPWFHVHVNNAVLSIGRYKSLYIITCKNPRVDFTKICQDCDVIKGVDYIHAWDRAMCLGLLRKLHENIS